MSTYLLKALLQEAKKRTEKANLVYVKIETAPLAPEANFSSLREGLYPECHFFTANNV